MAHMKRLTAPVTWPIDRKGNTFVMRPMPGKSFQSSIPLALIFKHMLRYCKTTKEAKRLLLDKEIQVDGKRQKEVRYLVGIMDVLSTPENTYRMLIDTKKKLKLAEIPKKEAGTKVVKVVGKTVLPKGKIQLNLSDSRNVIVKDHKYTVGDSLLIELPDQKIKEGYKLKKGNYAYLIGGNHVGEHGTIDKIEDDMVTIKTEEDSFETPTDFVYVVGKDKPAVTIQ